METVDQCPICGSMTSSFALSAKDHTVSHEDYTIRKCDSCGFHFTSPRPNQDQIGKYYLSEDYISHAAKATSLKDRVYHTVRRRAIRGKHKLIQKYHGTGSVLDIGCGTGDFLAYLKQQGYAAQGVEVSDQARSLAELKGLPVANELEHIPAKNQFKVVSLWHVLEHMPDPLHTLGLIHARSADDALLIIAVPDRSSWDCDHYGALWAAWDVPRHLLHFRRKDMRQLLTRSGFELIESRNMWFDAPYVSMLSEQYCGAGPMRALIKGAITGLWSNLIAWAANSPTSSTLFLARKAKTPRGA